MTSRIIKPTFRTFLSDEEEKSVELIKPSDIVAEMANSRDEASNLCQNEQCASKGYAVKVCHHSDCREKNHSHPILLCGECDEKIHSDPEFRGHLRFDMHSKDKNGLSRRVSTHSLPDSIPSEDSTSISSNDVTDSSASTDIKYRDKEPVQEAAIDATDATTSQTVNKFKRKKALKNRRALTDHSISKECFTVKFDILGEPEIEILAAIQGVSLRDALLPACEKRGILVDKVYVFLDASHTPLPVHIDTFPLGGSTLHIKAKDGVSPFRTTGKSPSNSNKNTAERMKADKKSGAGSLGRAHKKSSGSVIGLEELFSDMNSNTSPYNSLTAADSKKLSGRSSNSKLGAFFLPNFSNKDKDKHDQLNEQLLFYSFSGLPEMPELLTLGEPHFDENLFTIENHWTDFIDKTGMSKKERDQQEAIWELLVTEIHYIQALHVICDLFMCCLINLQNEQLLNEIETEKLFSNIREIRVVNCQFWEEKMLPVLEHSRTQKVPLDPLLVVEGFHKFEETFQPYTKYCLEQGACLEYMKNKYSDHELFRTFVEWAEAQKQCNRLHLRDLLVKPMQRITRYSLLLRAIIKKTEDEDTREELVKLVENVDKFVRSIDSTLRQSHEQERLAAIINRIESYDAVDMPNEEAVRALQHYSHLDLTCRMPGCGPQASRHLLMEKALKLKEGNSKIDVICLLFIDMLLITKPTNKRGDKVRVIKPPMRVDRIKVQGLRDGSSFLLIYLNEYGVASSAYLFQGEHIGKWIAMFMKAQHLYQEAREETTIDYLAGIDADLDSPSLAIIGRRSTRVITNEVNLPRSDSVESTDSKFIPNVSISKSRSSESLPQPVTHDMDEPVFSGSESQAEDYRRRAQSYSGERLRPPNVLYLASDDDDRNQVNESTDDPSPVVTARLQTAESPEQTSPSVSPKLRRRTPVSDTLRPKPVKALPRTDSISSSETSQGGSPVPGSPANQKQFILPNRPQIETIHDEQLKGRLNQRRVSRGEKRYHTADSIQDMQKQDPAKDAAIYKRLSWHLGTVDINIEEKSGILKNKAFISDSLCSIPSSSGVSSTGSLHLSPDSEISEENEQDLLNSQESNDYSTNSETDTDHTVIEKKTRFALSETESRPTEKNSSFASSKSKSKSMSDISNIVNDLSPSAVKDGISSVDLPKSNRKKLSHAEILRMKKQLLLNSSTEASEV